MGQRWDDLQAQNRKHCAQRDEARKWARYYYQKYLQLLGAWPPPFVVTVPPPTEWKSSDIGEIRIDIKSREVKL